MKNRPTSPKLSQPAELGALARPRVFTVLDEAASSAVIWISGPAGAGKTTLVASYLKARARKALWYRFDATDSDPGTLFDHLSRARPALRLPKFVERYRAGSEAFAHQFFRRMFAQSGGEPWTLVLDSAERAPSTTLLARAAEEAGDGAQLIITSREPPPPPFMRLALQGQVVQIGWDTLRFSEDETLALVRHVSDSSLPETRSSAPVSDLDAGTLHRRCGGWAAGLRLVLEQIRNSTRWQQPGGPMQGDALFGYIASEVFEALSPPLQTVLLQTCLLPDVSPRQAAALSGKPQAAHWLEDLARRHVLIDRLESRPTVYRYHDLFRDFLMSRLRQTVSAEAVKRLQRRSGDLLATAGRPEHAIGLLASAGDWLRASQLILDNAAAMMARGHAVALHQWVNALPAWYVDATPRLLYCLGLAQSSVDSASAMKTLERAYYRFDAQSNRLGMALCAGGLAQCYYFRLDDYHGLEVWGHRLAGLLEEDLEVPSLEVELHLRSMTQLALTFRDPGHPALADCIRRIMALLSRDIEVNQRVVAGALLLPCCDWLAPELTPLVLAVVRPLLKSPTLTAFNQLWWMSAEVQHHYCGHCPQAIEDAVLEIERIALRHGLETGTALPLNLALVRAVVGLRPRDRDGGIPVTLPTLAPYRRQESINALLYSADLLLREGDPERALRHAQLGLQACRDTGLVLAEIEALGLVCLALCMQGQLSESADALRQARSLSVTFESPHMKLHHLLLEARIGIASEGTAPPPASLLQVLSSALRLAADHGRMKGYIWAPELMATVCAVALEHEIAPAQARSIIDERQLPPPVRFAGERWPWRLLVRVLGAMEVRVQGQALRFEGKAQKKPLELLHTLVAAGRKGARADDLAVDLWPDSDGDAAASNLRMTLHRLRRLLHSEQVVLVEEGRMRLNPALTWIDAWAFEEACQAIETGSHAPRHDQYAGLDPVLRLYGGAPFQDAPTQSRTLGACERWRHRFARIVNAAGKELLSHSEWQAAARLFTRALDAEPHSETFYQGLIRAQLGAGQHEDALLSYNQCTAMLAADGGRLPSAVTAHLRAEIDHRHVA